jgi:hypothetical protein
MKFGLMGAHSAKLRHMNSPEKVQSPDNAGLDTSFLAPKALVQIEAASGSLLEPWGANLGAATSPQFPVAVMPEKGANRLAPATTERTTTRLSVEVLVANVSRAAPI